MLDLIEEIPDEREGTRAIYFSGWLHRPGEPACYTQGTSEASSLLLRSLRKTNNA